MKNLVFFTSSIFILSVIYDRFVDTKEVKSLNELSNYEVKHFFNYLRERGGGEGGKSKYLIEKLLLEKEIVASDVWDIDKTKNNHFRSILVHKI